jgi:lysyl-tRNA synthetase class 2
MNKDLILVRSAVIKAVRKFFDDQGFLELHTPRLIGLPGQEPYLEPMWTEAHEHDGKVHAAALITSPEYAMKKALGAGFDKIYDLGPCFRDGEPWDGTHDVEFMMIEWYRRDAGLEELMQDTEALVRNVTSVILSETKNLTPRLNEILHRVQDDAPFRRITVAEAMKQYAQVELDPLLADREAMARVCREHGQSVTDADSWDDLFFKIFLSEVEPKLGWNDGRTAWQPTFLYKYPASMAALARKDVDDPRYALRVEFYIGDLELANGFAELSDATEQRQRFEEEQALRQSLGKKTWPIDERFLEALPKMGDAAGIAFGVDRLAMLIAGTGSISDLMPIPVRERF